jgi:hypothetical protein
MVVVECAVSLKNKAMAMVNKCVSGVFAVVVGNSPA